MTETNFTVTVRGDEPFNAGLADALLAVGIAPPEAAHGGRSIPLGGDLPSADTFTLEVPAEDQAQAESRASAVIEPLPGEFIVIRD